jgi:hypothetical protein
LKWNPLKIERPRGNRWSRLSDGSSTSPDIFTADPIERSAVRRYLEPLEFDCALHYDPGFARLHGYEDVVPVSALSTFAMGPMWCPGERIFLSQDRNAPPARSAVSGNVTGLEPVPVGNQTRRMVETSLEAVALCGASLLSDAFAPMPSPSERGFLNSSPQAEPSVQASSVEPAEQGERLPKLRVFRRHPEDPLL